MNEWTDNKGLPLDRAVMDRVMSHVDPRYWLGVRRLWWRFNRTSRTAVAIAAFVTGGVATWLIQ